ncbi:uncharacterized protein P174DRAFT_78258 [Aspergillus novofumigatus IBT 16806]|uniref:Uncharacterized protein n=1 Tax=Aspergillus novofumigatus (strain IBT 16806) TaxID=1392255 RepID=A0A2I1CFQ8_ASPN1|nr:uncharacterized protein P174DRAFT_78258 [Aspergillus novofumigatus IBT 16806]PKX96441.1 hypothetical protein P174DRAFT_78258 [Aspergillus novofumigatus IBT 16806]
MYRPRASYKGRRQPMEKRYFLQEADYASYFCNWCNYCKVRSEKAVVNGIDHRRCGRCRTI